MGVPEQEHKSNEAAEHGGISVSERKRLQSLKEKKEAFRAKEQAVQNALRNLDNKPRKNKIIFDDNFDDVPSTKVPKTDGLKNKKNKQNEKKKDLFDNDEDAEEDEIQPNWDCDEYQSKKATAQALGNKYTCGNDERFKLDERFLDDDERGKITPVQEGDEGDLEKEKEWQLKLLGNVLGVPIAPKNIEAPNAKKSMIRYDPSQKDHQSYEITQEREEPTKKTKKKKTEKAVNAIEEEEKPVEVSKDIYFSVSENLTKSFKEEGQFSLLKAFGKELPEKSEQEKNIPYDAKPTQITKSKFNFDTKNPFKYDSSDAENEDAENANKVSKGTNGLWEEEKHLPSKTDRFFFDANDARFDEAVKFFSKEALPTEEFKNVRRELKQIVRAKVRNNIQKSQPWGGKKKILSRPKQTSR